MGDDLDLFRATVSDVIAMYETVRRNPAPVIEAAAAIIQSLKAGGKLLLFGNGGSAADAQHVACELVSRFTRERQALPAIALTTDTSLLTAIGNDYTFDRVFVRQIEALGRKGDVAFGITTSGNSPNVVDALTLARTQGLRTVVLTGRDGGLAGKAAEIHINVPTPSTPRAQEVHMTLLHFICNLVELAWVNGGAPRG